MPVRTIKLRHRGISGRFPSEKTGRVLGFESRLERSHLLLLEADPAVAGYEEQPIRVEYCLEGRTRYYTPDCRVDYRDGRVSIVEVKYQSDVDAMDARERLVFDAAVAAATRYCRARGWTFKVATERDIITPALARAESLRAFSRLPDGFVGQARHVEAAVRQDPGITLGALASQRCSVDIARTCVGFLLWRGVLVERPFGSLAAATRLYLHGGTP